ncbi:MAG: hypothetical protein KGS72_16290, partial [Cyanobacteria bacterium REEB67]|nr:hypothetical protein [Cyanobacteria bacterium REEB67]
ENLGKDTASYAAFGMAFGGANYAFNRLTAPPTRTFTTDRSDAKVSFDHDGNPVKVEGSAPAITSDMKLGFQATKMANGSWSSSSWEDWGNMKGDAAASPNIEDVKVEGDDLFMSGKGVTREFTPDHRYVRVDLAKQAAKAAREAASAAEFAKYNNIEEGDGIKTTSNYNRDMKIASIKAESLSAPGQTIAKADIYYGKDGDLAQVSVSQPGQQLLRLTKSDAGDWYFTKNDQTYKFDGDVKILPRGGAGEPEQVQFTPRGAEPVIADLSGRDSSLNNAIEAHSAYLPGGTGRMVLNVDADGKASLTGGTSHYQKLAVNGRSIEAGQKVEIQPGDKVEVTSDIGDRYPIFETRELLWSRSLDGQPRLATTELTNGSQSDFKFDDQSTRVVPKNR